MSSEHKQLEKTLIDKCLLFLDDVNSDVLALGDICIISHNRLICEQHTIYLNSRNELSMEYNYETFACAINVKDSNKYNIYYIYLYLSWRFSDISKMYGPPGKKNILFDDIIELVKILPIPIVDIETQQKISQMFAKLSNIQSDLLAVCGEIESLVV